MSKILVGADPELFIRDITTGQPLSIIGRLGGTKDSTLFFDGMHGVLEDNCAAEFNIPPAPDAEAFVASINKCVKFIDEQMQKQGATILKNVASVSFHPNQLDTDAAWIFGCEPDYNAYTGEQNPKPHAQDINLRSAGGHVHIGCGPLNDADKQNVIRAADLFLGVPSVLLDDDVQRRELYGKSGAFRYKSYGVEYRTLSNFWIFSEDLIRMVYERTQQLHKWATDNWLCPKSEEAGMIQRCINTGDKGIANELFKMYPQVAV